MCKEGGAIVNGTVSQTASLVLAVSKTLIAFKRETKL